jgi:excisionase family DNA binding protein
MTAILEMNATQFDSSIPASIGECIGDIQACADADSSKFLTADEAAVYLGGLNSRTVTRWAREGYLPAIPIGEGKRRLWRFLQTDLEEWMLARRQGGQNAA